ncbi:hypothetical protein [Tropicibacter sp. S64]|uniref:hypothetical protein n=1 Tax=Tropicibacter sp. S64 TaxID=3415122 RepID=UPI003C7E9EBB
MPRILQSPCIAVLAALPCSGLAEVLSTTNPSILDNLCVGANCAISEAFNSNYNQIEIKANNTRLLFDDTSNFGGFPSRDWAIQANDTTSGGEDQLMFIDASTGLEVMTIKAAASSSTLVLGADRKVGIGTELPQADLHIVTASANKIRMQDTFGGSEWMITFANGGFHLQDRGTLNYPFRIADNAPEGALWVRFDGRIGMGTTNPQSPLQINSADTATDGQQGIIVQNVSGVPGPRGLFTMRNNGGSYFSLENTGAGTTWYFTHEDRTPHRFIIADAVPDGPEMTLSADGVLTVPGGFVVGATALTVPDYVFDADYALRPLSEVSGFIAENGHLPEVPSAAEVTREGLDMARMQLAQLKKIEELTLYTLEQQAIIEAQARENAALADRLARIEARLARD